MILSLGPRLHVAGHVLSLPLPWVIPQRLPFVREHFLPARLAFAHVSPARSAGRRSSPISFTSGANGCRARHCSPSSLVVALAPLFPALPYPTAERDDTPRFFLRRAPSAIPKDSVALISPFAIAAGRSGTSRPMVWQARGSRCAFWYDRRATSSVPDARFDPLRASRTGRSSKRMIRDPGRRSRQRRFLPAERPADPAASFHRLHVQTIVVGPMTVRGRDESIRSLSGTCWQVPPRRDRWSPALAGRLVAAPAVPAALRVGVRGRRRRGAGRAS